MVDFTGQKRVFLISIVVFAISIPISILFAFYKDNYLYSLYCEVGVTAFLMLIFGPNWPYLNLDKPQWKADSEAKSVPVEQQKRQKGFHAKRK